MLDVFCPQVSAGVTLKEGGATKQGPPGLSTTATAAMDVASKNPQSPLGMGLNMTRRSYNEFLDTIQVCAGGLVECVSARTEGWAIGFY